MDIGMLWFDNDSKADFKAKVERAAVYYRDKYGTTPNLCFVHPTMLPVSKGPANKGPAGNGPALKTKGVEIRASDTMLPHHFWIGINRQETASAP